MEYIKKTTEYPLYNSRAFNLYFGGMDLGILDIETTGLSPRNSAFVLGGLASNEKGKLTAEQYFAETLSHEQETLKAFWEAASAKDVLITFNGQNFDIPFIKERLDGPAGRLPFHLDLYQVVKKYSPIRKFLPNLKQKSIEDYMGLWQYRKDEISGKDSIDLYYRWLTEKSQDVKEKILLHNHDDIVQLYRLLKVIEKTDLHQAMFYSGFPVRLAEGTAPALIAESIAIKGDLLRISGRQYRRPAEYQAYEYNGSMCFIHFDSKNGTFALELPLICQSGLTLADLQALGLEDTELDKYPACQEGFLILQNNDDINYLETNHFIKLFIERILSQWITNR